MKRWEYDWKFSFFISVPLIRTTNIVSSTTARMDCHVNKTLLPIKLFYLWFYAAVSSFGPFLPHFLQQKGYSAGDVSTILGIVPFVVLFVKPVIGHYADKTDRQKQTLLFCLLTGGIVLSLLYFVESIDGNIHQLHENQTNYTNISLNVSIRVDTVSRETHFSSYNFWLTLVLVIVANTVGLSPSYTIMDAVAMNILKKRPQDFGKQRMWMSVGLASAIFCVSPIMDKISEGQKHINYLPSFISFIFCIICCCVCVLFVKPVTNAGAKRKGEGLKSFLPILRKWNVLLFLFMAFVCGMNFGKSVWMTVYYMKELGSQQITIAVAVSVTSLTTMIFSLFAGRIIAKVGHEVALTLCLLAYGARAWLWTLVTNPWHALPIELLLGMSIGLWFVTMVSYANKIAPPGSQTSSQSVLSGVYDGLGSGVGNLSSGFIYHNYGGVRTWQAFATFSTACALLYLSLILCTIEKGIICARKTADTNDKEFQVIEQKPLKSAIAIDN